MRFSHVRKNMVLVLLRLTISQSILKFILKQTLDEVAHKKDPLDFIDLSQRRCLIGVSEKENEVIMDHGHEIVPL